MKNFSAIRLAGLGLVSAGVMVATQAVSAKEFAGGDVSGSAAVSNIYLFRGVDQSSFITGSGFGSGAISGDITYSNSGAYVGVDLIRQIEAANIKKYGILTCEYCKVPVGDTYHLEHKNPISRGGKSIEVNLCVACPPCNLSKGTLTAEEFRERLRVI